VVLIETVKLPPGGPDLLWTMALMVISFRHQTTSAAAWHPASADIASRRAAAADAGTPG
jgi:hypothetical protein